ncbi:recombinase [Chryseobacterium lactis]|uniref:Recombinase n=1 Tax=Chryseobacterium lactis TaxID=1241981 RepID=A0A3G6RCT4_CHRLC|nr:site-specific integrase [Chryseobacterium lactis]AZA82480.1 site-specific integrase [Chryseobacterium lactis]AZB02862.1 site-specific integrase [Chryseobacterium lactis]PNW13844.1 recombinase [Chryseobacterium lactis]
MLEKSFGAIFFLKTPEKKENLRVVYLRITVDGIPKEISTKRKWDSTRWNQKSGRATGNKEDAKSLNYFLDSLSTRISNYRTELINNDQTITSQKLIDFVKGKNVSKAKVLEEFSDHNSEILALVETKEYAIGTYERYQIAKSHAAKFIKFKYNRDDLEFRELNFAFIRDYELYLKTVRNCSNNTALKYIANFKTIVLRAIAKDIIPRDPFKLFKSKKTKIKKKPLSTDELFRLENKVFSSERLSLIRDIFVFQCYTGLAYIDAYQLKPSDIKKGIDGTLWIMSSRQKSKSETDIPLLPKAIEIMERYQDHPLCIKRGSVLPVKSNQKMNEYLKEIAILCDLPDTLNTHKARRTFGSTVTLKNGVPLHIVKEMMGHYSVKQTEEYAITEQESISLEMLQLKEKLNKTNDRNQNEDPLLLLHKLQDEIAALGQKNTINSVIPPREQLLAITSKLDFIKEMLLSK